jgi:TIR domain
MTNDDGRKPEGAPERSPKAGAGAPSGVDCGFHRGHFCYHCRLKGFCWMSSLAELPDLVGFFSYSRRDDEHSGGALSRLRGRIHDELRMQLGRDVRLWQDTEAIPHGTLWEDKINSAIAESVFFIPIVTPSAVASENCKFEFESFLKREVETDRKDLIFPILYIRVHALENEEKRRQNEVLKITPANMRTGQKFGCVT